jgi:tRNA(Leu) C34 or U34 (ribose-2'-O)-methylase TrmL
MDKETIREYMEELRKLPTNEVNIQRLAAATTALNNYHMIQNDEFETELSEISDAYNAYRDKKRHYANTKSHEAQKAAENALKIVCMSIEETISELWSQCEAETEKNIIEDSMGNLIEKIK